MWTILWFSAMISAVCTHFYGSKAKYIIGTKEKGKQWQNKKEANGRLLQESF